MEHSLLPRRTTLTHHWPRIMDLRSTGLPASIDHLGHPSPTKSCSTERIKTCNHLRTISWKASSSRRHEPAPQSSKYLRHLQIKAPNTSVVFKEWRCASIPAISRRRSRVAARREGRACDHRATRLALPTHHRPGTTAQAQPPRLRARAPRPDRPERPAGLASDPSRALEAVKVQLISESQQTGPHPRCPSRRSATRARAGRRRGAARREAPTRGAA
mmetsp:Transcript_45350/g.119025  ORF Transcript_45350/g.119025 Transcript_45350/m.119025 type:complete len:217 (+) Transcript_45350:309-959(+)